MRKVLLLATTTGYQIRAFGEAARKLDVKLVFASDRCDQLDDPWWDQAIPVRFHEEAPSVDAVVEAFGGTRPAGVLAVGDRPVPLAARVSRAFDLQGHSPAAAAATRNKLAMRQALSSANLPVPWFHVFQADASSDSVAAAVQYPCVVKPLALSGSRGVIRANDPGELTQAITRVRAILRASDVRAERDAAHDAVLVEQFIPGREFAVEGLLTGGEFRILALFDKPDPLDGPYFEETIYVTPSALDGAGQSAMRDAIAAAALALDLWHGPIHAECRVNDSGVNVLEVAARPIGGLCARALRFNDDAISLEEVLLRHAMGEDVSACRQVPGASGVMMIPIPKRGIYRGVDGVGEARAVPGVAEIQITAKPDTMLVPLPEGKSYLGFVFARGADADAVDRALRDAHARLQFAIDREVAVI